MKGMEGELGCRGRMGEKRALVVCKKKERVMENQSAGREVDRCPVQVQWSGVFNLT